MEEQEKIYIKCALVALRDNIHQNEKALIRTIELFEYANTGGDRSAAERLKSVIEFQKEALKYLTDKTEE